MDAFYAIAEPTRRSIVEMLSQKGHLSATDISDNFDISAAAVSQHLKVLREAHVVQVHKRGQKRIYELDVHTMYELERWAHTMSRQWNDRLDRLDLLLKAKKK